MVRDPNVSTRLSQYPDALSIFHAVMGTAPVENYAPIATAWDFSRASVVADLGGGGGIKNSWDNPPSLRRGSPDRDLTFQGSNHDICANLNSAT